MLSNIISLALYAEQADVKISIEPTFPGALMICSSAPLQFDNRELAAATAVPTTTTNIPPAHIHQFDAALSRTHKSQQ